MRIFRIRLALSGRIFLANKNQILPFVPKMEALRIKKKFLYEKEKKKTQIFHGDFSSAMRKAAHTYG